MYIDAHAHLLKTEYGSDLEEELKKIERSDIKIVNNVGYDLNSSEEAVNLSKHNDFMFATIGIHPYDAENVDESTLQRLEILSNNAKVIAIGEIGLDYFRNISDFSIQKKIFQKQLILAKKLQLPFMVHSRNAFDDTFKIINEVGYFNGVFHSFDYGKEELKKILDKGLHVSFSGMLTFKNKKELVDAASFAPVERVLLETDSPYLAPVPMRGKRNSPLFVRYVYEKFASIKKMNIEEIADSIEKNFKRLFKKACTERRQNV